jgi:hypothetical protein
VLNNYEKGYIVLCLHEIRKVGIMPKLEKRFHGPFIITNKLSPLNFEIQMDKDGTKEILHHIKLKRYEGVQHPRWVSKLA